MTSINVRASEIILNYTINLSPLSPRYLKSPANIHPQMFNITHPELATLPHATLHGKSTTPNAITQARITKPIPSPNPPSWGLINDICRYQLKQIGKINLNLSLS